MNAAKTAKALSLLSDPVSSHLEEALNVLFSLPQQQRKKKIDELVEDYMRVASDFAKAVCPKENQINPGTNAKQRKQEDKHLEAKKFLTKYAFNLTASKEDLEAIKNKLAEGLQSPDVKIRLTHEISVYLTQQSKRNQTTLRVYKVIGNKLNFLKGEFEDDNSFYEHCWETWKMSDKRIAEYVKFYNLTVKYPRLLQTQATFREISRIASKLESFFASSFSSQIEDDTHHFASSFWRKPVKNPTNWSFQETKDDITKKDIDEEHTRMVEQGYVIEDMEETMEEYEEDGESASSGSGLEQVRERFTELL